MFFRDRKTEDWRDTLVPARFQWVEFDGSPVRYIEPVADAGFSYRDLSNATVLRNPHTERDQIVRFEYFDSHTINDVHRFD